MAVVEEVLRSEKDGAISFGNHKLEKKAKVEDFQHEGDLLKVKTCKEITKLEKNGMFLYESVPGTSVLTDGKAYEVFVNGESAGAIKTGFGGKLSLSVELEALGDVPVKIVQI